MGNETVEVRFLACVVFFFFLCVFFFLLCMCGNVTKGSFILYVWKCDEGFIHLYVWKCDEGFIDFVCVEM